MYILIDENTIMPYNNEVLKRYVGSRLVKAISNPTDKDLAEFGYMDLIEGDKPIYDDATQALTYHYEVKDGNIVKIYGVVDIVPEEGAGINVNN